MGTLAPEILEAAVREREVTLTTQGRKSSTPRKVTIWIVTDGKRIFIRSGRGLGRNWTQNLMARDEGVLEAAGKSFRFKPRLVAEPEQARAVSVLYGKKYGSSVKPSKPTEPPTPGELATFEVMSAQ